MAVPAAPCRRNTFNLSRLRAKLRPDGVCAAPLNQPPRVSYCLQCKSPPGPPLEAGVTKNGPHKAFGAPAIGAQRLLTGNCKLQSQSGSFSTPASTHWCSVDLITYCASAERWLPSGYSRPLAVDLESFSKGLLGSPKCAPLGISEPARLVPLDCEHKRKQIGLRGPKFTAGWQTLPETC